MKSPSFVGLFAPIAGLFRVVSCRKLHKNNELQLPVEWYEFCSFKVREAGHVIGEPAYGRTRHSLFKRSAHKRDHVSGSKP